MRAGISACTTQEKTTLQKRRASPSKLRRYFISSSLHPPLDACSGITLFVVHPFLPDFQFIKRVTPQEPE